MFFASLCVLWLSMGSARASRDLEYNFYPKVHGYLKLHKEPADWLAARVDCYLEGALLAAPWSDEFVKIVHNLQSNQEHLLPSVYSGAQMKLPDGVFKYDKGEPVLSLEPKTLKSLERCIVFLANGTIGIVDCKQQLPYVCYAPVSACGEKIHGYELASRTGHCYKLHTRSNDWLNTHRICQAEGAHLAIVNSDAEAQDLAELLQKHPENSLSSYIKNYVAIGIYYRKLQNAWFTIHDQTLEQAGYAKWHVGAPYNDNNYGYLHRDGTLINNSTYATPFLCEKEPVLIDFFGPSSLT